MNQNKSNELEPTDTLINPQQNSVATKYVLEIGDIIKKRFILIEEPGPTSPTNI